MKMIPCRSYVVSEFYIGMKFCLQRGVQRCIKASECCCNCRRLLLSVSSPCLCISTAAFRQEGPSFPVSTQVVLMLTHIMKDMLKYDIKDHFCRNTLSNTRSMSWLVLIIFVNLSPTGSSLQETSSVTTSCMCRI